VEAAVGRPAGTRCRRALTPGHARGGGRARRVVLLRRVLAGQRRPRPAQLRDPLRHIGALTGPDVFHPGRSGRTALRIAARPARIPGQRVEEVLHLVGLEPR